MHSTTLILTTAALAGACGSSPAGTEPDASVDPDASIEIDAYAGPSITRTYQQGVDGYTGTKSTGISTYSGLGTPGQYNANGMTFADGQNDWCTGTDIPSGNYSEVWLLRFDELGLPAGAQVVAATLTIHGHGDGSAGQYFAGSYLAASWYGDTPISCAGCSSSPVGWRYRDGSSNPWGSLGAGTPGTDTIASKLFRLPASGDVGTGSAPTELTTNLDPAVVQGWVDGANYGVRIIAGESFVHMGYVQSQRDPGGRPLAMRPKLTISIAP